KHRLELGVGRRNTGLVGSNNALHLEVVGSRHPAVLFVDGSQFTTIDRLQSSVRAGIRCRLKHLVLLRRERLEEFRGGLQCARAGLLNSLLVVVGHRGSTPIAGKQSRSRGPQSRGTVSKRTVLVRSDRGLLESQADHVKCTSYQSGNGDRQPASAAWRINRLT